MSFLGSEVAEINSPSAMFVCLLLKRKQKLANNDNSTLRGEYKAAIYSIRLTFMATLLSKDQVKFSELNSDFLN